MKEEGVIFITNADVGRNYKAARSFVILTALSWHAALLIQEILMFLEEMLLVSILQWII